MTVTAKPYTARQCPECKVWVYVDLAPFAEDDRTKTLRDWMHWRDEHLDPETDLSKSVGFPYFFYNKESVQAVIEDREVDV